MGYISIKGYSNIIGVASFIEDAKYGVAPDEHSASAIEERKMLMHDIWLWDFVWIYLMILFILVYDFLRVKCP